MRRLGPSHVSAAHGIAVNHISKGMSQCVDYSSSIRMKEGMLITRQSFGLHQRGRRSTWHLHPRAPDTSDMYQIGIAGDGPGRAHPTTAARYELLARVVGRFSRSVRGAGIIPTPYSSQTWWEKGCCH